MRILPSISFKKDFKSAVDQARTLLAKQKYGDVQSLLERALKSFESKGRPDESKLLAESYAMIAETLSARSLRDESIEYFRKSIETYENPDVVKRACQIVNDARLVKPEHRFFFDRYHALFPSDQKMILTYAKILLAQEEIAPEEEEIIVAASKAYPLWKGGSGLLARKFLAEGRTDAEALTIYRNAYPNNKQNEKLRRVLLDSLIASRDMSDFAVNLYRDTLEKGQAPPDALGLYVTHLIKKGQVSERSLPYFDQALDGKLLDRDALKALAAFVTTTDKDFIDKRHFAEKVFDNGYSDESLLVFLSETYAGDHDFSTRAMSVFEQSLAQNALSKRSILLLAEHLLAADDTGNFAARIYERYISLFPERPVKKLPVLLSRNYISNKRTDDKAQRIFEDALKVEPDDRQILEMLTRSYLAYDNTSPQAIEAYHAAFDLIAEEGLRREIARILAFHNIAQKQYTEDTLNYIETYLPHAPNREKAKLEENLALCYLTLSRRDERAKQAYLSIYPKEKDRNPKLIKLLAEMLVEEDRVFAKDSVEMEIFKRLFDLDRFSCHPKVAFLLLESRLRDHIVDKTTVSLAVRCFEADEDGFVELFRLLGKADLLQDMGQFYTSHYNFQMASKVYHLAYREDPTDQNVYNYAKLLVVGGQTEQAFKMLDNIQAASLSARKKYWQAVGKLAMSEPEQAEKLLDDMTETADSVPDFLLKVRQAMVSELSGGLDAARKQYQEILSQPDAKPIHRWLRIQTGVLLIKLGELDEAEKYFEELHKANPSSRKEAQFLGTTYILQGLAKWDKAKPDESLAYFEHAIQATQGHDALREVLAAVLHKRGEAYFLEGNFALAVRVLELALIVSPKSTEIKTLLAYAYHMLKDYGRALMQYSTIKWTDENPFLERSQAYAYMSAGQFNRAWKVFLDLHNRGNLLGKDLPLFIVSFLTDENNENAKQLARVDFMPPSFELGVVYLRDGAHERAEKIFTNLLKKSPDDLHLIWYTGLTYARMGKRDLAIHHWKRLLDILKDFPETKERVSLRFLEVGLAFLEAGYGKEAMETWEHLRELNPNFKHLNSLYAVTLSLNAYNLAKQDQVGLAINEWKRAHEYDKSNSDVIHNLAIAYLLTDEFEKSAGYWNRLIKIWKDKFNRNPRKYSHYSFYISEVQKLLTDIIVSRERAEHDVTVVQTETKVDYYKKANRFYWILGLDKNSSTGRIEKEYFRLVKIFNPERHADDFMLVEEAYSNLNDPVKRERIDIFALNPVNVPALRTLIFKEEKYTSAFIISPPQLAVPGPDYSNLKPSTFAEEEYVGRIGSMLALAVNIGDWTLI